MPVYDFRADRADNAFLVMEHLRGGSISDRMSVAALRPEETAEFLRQVLDGLAAAHQAGMVHRDLKPSNLLFTGQPVAQPAGSDAPPFDHVKIIDFGLARILDDDRITRLTQTGHMIGTPGYLAPEQALGGDVDLRADVYAIGIIGYRCLTRVYPFEASTAGELLQALLNQRPRRLGEILPGADKELEELLWTAIQRDPDARFQSAAAMRDALDLWLQKRGCRPSFRPPPSEATDPILRGERQQETRGAELVTTQQEVPSERSPPRFDVPPTAPPRGTAPSEPSPVRAPTSRISFWLLVALVAVVALPAIAAGLAAALRVASLWSP